MRVYCHFCRWFSHSCFALVFPVYFLWFWNKSRPYLAASVSPNDLLFISAAWGKYKSRIEARTGGSFRRFVCVAFLFSCFSTALAYLWYVLVPMGEVGTLTAIFNTSTVFAYLFSLWLLDDRSNRIKWLAVSFSLLGLLLLFLASTPLPGDISSSANESTFSTGVTSSRENMANILCLLNAILHGLYEAIYKRLTIVGTDLSSPLAPLFRLKAFLIAVLCLLTGRSRPRPIQEPSLSALQSSKSAACGEYILNTSPVDFCRNIKEGSDSFVSPDALESVSRPMETFETPIQSSVVKRSTSSAFLGLQYFAWIGISTFFCHWPVILFLHFTTLEIPRVAPDLDFRHVIMIFCANGVLSVLFNLCFLLALTLTSPVFASVGAMITIPVSLCIDFVFFEESFDLLSLLGTLTIIASFSLMIYAEYNESQIECL